MLYSRSAIAQIMQAAFELGRAGFSFAQTMGTLRGTLNLALAGDIGTKDAADIATVSSSRSSR